MHPHSWPTLSQAALERITPQFSGKESYHCQEFLAYLLGSLHEDLNLVRKKPHVDMTIKTKGREEKVGAKVVLVVHTALCHFGICDSGHSTVWKLMFRDLSPTVRGVSTLCYRYIHVPRHCVVRSHVYVQCSGMYMCRYSPAECGRGVLVQAPPAEPECGGECVPGPVKDHTGLL